MNNTSLGEWCDMGRTKDLGAPLCPEARDKSSASATRRPR